MSRICDGSPRIKDFDFGGASHRVQELKPSSSTDPTFQVWRRCDIARFLHTVISLLLEEVIRRVASQVALFYLVIAYSSGLAELLADNLGSLVGSVGDSQQPVIVGTSSEHALAEISPIASSVSVAAREEVAVDDNVTALTTSLVMPCPPPTLLPL
ncbi:hypothetical protein Droror1_Dr00012924 [Drosera rotundifolia]